VPKPKSVAELLITTPPPSVDPRFETVPGIMQNKGRVEGFESLRDMLLANWRELAAQFEIPLPQLLKLVLETDRHALFAAIAEEKLGDADRTKQKKWEWFQGFLGGDVDVPLSPDEKLSELPGTAEVAESEE